MKQERPAGRCGVGRSAIVTIGALSLVLICVNVWNESNSFRPVRTDEAHQLHTALDFAWHFGLEGVAGPLGSDLGGSPQVTPVSERALPPTAGRHSVPVVPA